MYYTQHWTELMSLVSWSKKLALKLSSHTGIQHRDLIWLVRKVFAEIGHLFGMLDRASPVVLSAMYSSWCKAQSSLES